MAFRASAAAESPPTFCARQEDSGVQRITSRDGTPIAAWRSGQGPALLLVHGTVADHSTTWRLARHELEQRFTIYAMDRRGRGGSGDAPDYALQREAEDVAAVVDSIGEPVNLLGHSYGALRYRSRPAHLEGAAAHHLRGSAPPRARRGEAGRDPAAPGHARRRQRGRHARRLPERGGRCLAGAGRDDAF